MEVYAEKYIFQDTSNNQQDVKHSQETVEILMKESLVKEASGIDECMIPTDLSKGAPFLRGREHVPPIPQ